MGFLIWIAFSMLCAMLAESRGRNPVVWFFIAIIASPIIGLIAVFICDDLSEDVSITNGNKKTCPYCAETIQAAAIKCKHCGSEQKASISESENDKALKALIDNLKK